MISKFNVLREYVVTYTTWGTRDDIKTYNVKATRDFRSKIVCAGWLSLLCTSGRRTSNIQMFQIGMGTVYF